MSILSKRLFPFLAFLILTASPLLVSSSHAQSAPDAVFVVGGVVTGGTSYPGDVAPASWSHNGTFSTGTADISGSTTSTSVTLNSEVDISGNPTPFFTQGGVARHTVQIYVKGRSSAEIEESTSASVSVTSAGGAVEAHYEDIPWNGDSLSVSQSSTGSDSDTWSSTSSTTKNMACTGSGGGSLTLPGFPGVTYYKADSAVYTIESYAEINGSLSQSANASGSTTISVTLGAATPLAVADGPYVGGVLVSNPGRTSSVTINNNSYDPDNNAGTSGRPGICQASWTIYNPNGTSSVQSGLTSATFAVNNPGVYRVVLDVTDNEGATSQTEVSFPVGQLRTGFPGSGPKDEPMHEVMCGDSKLRARVGYGNGNAQVTWMDPVRTRGFPLSNKLHVNSQERFSTSSSPFFGNAAFTYGVRVTEETIDTGGGPALHYILTSGDGAQFNYGPTSSAPTQEPGVYGVLSVTGSGYELTDAGPPEEIFKAGNFNYEFDSNGVLLKVIDPAGNEQELTYDTGGEPLEILDVSSDRVIEFEYDTPGQVARIVENGGFAVTHLTYASNRITEIVLKDALGTTIREAEFTYNGDGLLETVTRDGDASTELTFDYTDAGNNVFVANVEKTSSEGSSLNYGQVPGTGAVFSTKRTNSNNGAEYYEFNTYGDLVKVILPTMEGGSAAPTYTFGRNSSHQMISWTDGVTTYNFTYTSNGLISEITNNASGSWEYTYSGVDVLTVTDALGLLYTFDYTDGSNPHHVTSITDADSHEWTFTYNSFGQLLTSVPPTGSELGTTTYAYEETALNQDYGYLRSVTNGAGDVVTYVSYTSLGDVEEVETNPSSGVTDSTTYSYDAAQRVTEITHPDTKTYSLSYTGFKLSEVVDEAGSIYEYDWCNDCGGMKQADLPLSKSLSWDRDEDFDVTDFVDGRSNSTTYLYGNAKELKTATYPDGSEFKSRYDNYGRLSRFTIPTNVYTSYVYDSLGRVTTENFSPSSQRDLQYTYLTDNRLSTATHGGGTTTYSYNGRREIDHIAYDFSYRSLATTQNIELTYYPDGLLETITWENGTTTVASWTYEYDGAGRITEVSNSFSESSTYTYDGEGKLLTQVNSNGTETEFTYNEDRNWPTDIEHTDGSTAFESYSLVYDGGSNTVGNITKVTELSTDETDYGYDALYRVTADERTGTYSYTNSYDYDLANNLDELNGSSFASFNSVNEITSLSIGSATHDANGDTTALSITGLPAATLTWSVARTLTLLSASGNTTYYYNDNRLRVYRQGGGVTKYFIFLGDKLLGEVHGSTPQRAYTWGANGITSMRHIGASNSYFYHHGPRGETTQVTNSAGSVVVDYRYDAYGNIVGTSGSLDNPFKFGGKYGYYSDENAIGLILAGARWYSPKLRRWLTRDPIEYDGGDNLYAYVEGNPVGFVDPEGLTPQAIAISTSTEVILPVSLKWLAKVAAATSSGAWVAGVGIGGYVLGTYINDEFGDELGDWIWATFGEEAPSLTLCNEKNADSDPYNPNRDWSKDRKLSDGEAKRIKKSGEDIHQIKGRGKVAIYDLFKDRKGNIYVKPKSGAGPGEYTGLNINDF